MDERGMIRVQTAFPPALLARFTIVAKCVGFTGRSDALRFLVAKWLTHIEKDPKAAAVIARWEKEVREELSGSSMLDFNTRDEGWLEGGPDELGL